MAKKTKLKATLSSFQEKQRQAQIQKTKESAKKEIIKKNSGNLSAKSKGKRPVQSKMRPSTVPLSSTDTILLIGEGNFSFARALLSSDIEKLAHLPPQNIAATTYDSEDACYEKYPDAHKNVRELREKGVLVLFDVDARRLETRKELKKRKWQRVVWNFPHAGKGISDQDRNVLSNQLLILDFLKSVAPLLEDGAVPSMIPNDPSRRRRVEADDDEDDEEPTSQPDDQPSSTNPQIKQRGTVLITLRNSAPYTLWDVPRLAKKPPEPHISSVSPSISHARYIQLRSFAFHAGDWKGYEHRLTKGWVDGLGRGTGGSTDKVEERTWEFCLKDKPEVYS